MTRTDLWPYWDQLKHIAALEGVDIRQACLDAGVGGASLWRWDRGKCGVHENTARKVLKQIHKAAAAKPRSLARQHRRSTQAHEAATRAAAK